MSNIRDPKNFDPRIITGADESAARMFRSGQLNTPPVEPRVEMLEKQFQRLQAQAKATAIRLNATMDYLGYLGMFLGQELDENMFPAGPTHTPEGAFITLFEELKAHGIIDKMPERSFDAYFAEHHKLADILLLVNITLTRNPNSMKEVLDTVREFNNDPQRITKIRGEQFGLVEYLNTNPDNLSDEEIKVLGEEFELNITLKEDEDTNEENVEHGQGGEAEEVPPSGLIETP